MYSLHLLHGILILKLFLSCPLKEEMKNFSTKDLNIFFNSNSDNIRGDDKCFELFLRKGHFEYLESYLNQLLVKGVKFKEPLDSAISSYSKFLNSLKDKFKFKESEFQKVMPAIRWAQNKEYIFLEIKFSHRHDAPGKILF